MLLIRFKKGNYAEQLELFGEVLGNFPEYPYEIRTKAPGVFEIVSNFEQDIANVLADHGFTLMFSKQPN